VALFDAARAAGVADEDAVLGHRGVRAGEERRRGGEVVAPVRRHPDLAAAVATVPPNLVAVLGAGTAEEVADGQVLDVDAVGLHLDAVTSVRRQALRRRVAAAGARARRQGAVEDHAVAVHAAKAHAGRGDQDAVLGRRRFVVHAGSDKDRVARLGCSHRGLDRPVRPGGAVFFKECEPVQAFEPVLTAALYERWPDRVPEVLGYDVERARLLMADAGGPIGARGNPPETWQAVLPLYAELQNGEADHVDEHLTNGVPDLRVPTLPARYEELLRHSLPLTADEIGRLRGFEPRFREWCEELAGSSIPASVQHDDLHMNNVYEKEGTLRVMDWGDASVAHPFFSLVITFRFL